MYPTYILNNGALFGFVNKFMATFLHVFHKETVRAAVLSEIDRRVVPGHVSMTGIGSKGAVARALTRQDEMKPWLVERYVLRMLLAVWHEASARSFGSVNSLVGANILFLLWWEIALKIIRLK